MERLKRKIYILLVVGGIIVAANFFIVSLFFDPWSWEAWWVANGFHFVGGIYAFFFIEALYSFAKQQTRIEMPRMFEALFFIGGALILGVFWEWFEFAIDRYYVLVVGRDSLMTYADTMGDLFLDTAGAIAASLFFYGKR